MGIGALFISKEVNHLLHPTRVGWRSVENEEDFYHLQLKDLDSRLKADARRFEPGTFNLAGITALGASLEMLLEIGIEHIFARICGLNDVISSGIEKRNLKLISSMEPRHRSGILSFVPGDAAGLFRHLLERNVLCAQRGNAVRLSPHFYNDASDTEKLFEALDSY